MTLGLLSLLALDYFDSPWDHGLIELNNNAS